MAKETKSQWNFGELFPTEQLRKVLSVAELTSQIRRLLEERIGTVWVGGEVSNLKRQSSGHSYFTLKDASAQLNCVLFRDEVPAAVRDLLEDGRKVILRGEVTVYEVRGQYQLLVRQVELQGVGALQIAFEKLKQKLQAEGLFATERKRPLPKYPQRIGLVTSPTGAAIRDVLHVFKRRNPALEIILAPCRVQGDGAAREIAEAIRLLNEFNLSLDLILVTRGGGSLEDLWAFNEEIVARAIFDSMSPVVSAVGHEIDFTISDFVADIRAATPSAAAEVITEGIFSSCKFVSVAGNRMTQLARQQLEAKGFSLANLARHLARAHPRRKLNDWAQRLDDLQTTLVRCGKKTLRARRDIAKNFSQRLWRVRPARSIAMRGELLEQQRSRLGEHVEHRLRETRNRLKNLQSRLSLLGPEQVLARGYSMTMDAKSGKILRAAKEVKAGQKLKTRLKAGEVVSSVESSK